MFFIMEKHYAKSQLNAKISSHLVYIKNEVDPSFGTGVLLDIGGKRFVLTAYHVIEGARPEDLFINLGIPYKSTLTKKKVVYENKELDFALIELDAFESEIMRDKIEPYKVASKGMLGNHPEFDRSAFCGYPAIRHEGDPNYPLRPSWSVFEIVPLHVDHWPEEVKPIVNPDWFYILDFNPNRTPGFLDHDGKVATSQDMMELHGMSGGPLWLLERKSAFTDKPVYALYGILVQYWTKAKVWQFTRVDVIFELLEKHGIIKLDQVK
jgi:hypothetical protein